MDKYVSTPYLNNVTCPPELLGISQLMVPFAQHVSAQRSTMSGQHQAQAQIVDGCEHPRCMTGWESRIGEYEVDTSARDQGIQIRNIIPRFDTTRGIYPIKETPYWTIIYRGSKDGIVSYINLEKYTMRSPGFGYQNKFLNVEQLHVGNYIPEDMKLCTSPAHDGNKYALGTNLNVAYMSIPQVTKDAVMISESAAKKLESTGIDRVAIRISPDQIPRNLYGNVSEYKFIPDVGEEVREDGILCALCRPTADSFVTDISPENLTRVQYLHDDIFYIPVGAIVTDIEVYVNRKCKVKTPKEMFQQVDKYRTHINQYNREVWNAYQQAVKEGLEVSPKFNSLVTRCLESSIADGEHIPGLSKKADATLVKKKEAIEFIYVIVTYKYKHKVSLGNKLAILGYGAKGVVSAIMPDELMPTDEQGFRADIIYDSVSVVNRMNPGSVYQQFVNRGARMIQRRIQSMTDDQAWQLILEWLNDTNPNFAQAVAEEHKNPVERKAFIKESRESGLYTNIMPYQEGLDTKWVLKLAEKYNIKPSKVKFGFIKSDGTVVMKESKQPVMIGEEYVLHLYKMPHLMCAGVSYINQYHCPVRPSSIARDQFPYSLTPLRFGEDETRNITMAAGPKVAARLLGIYASSPRAIEMLCEHQLYSKVPSRLKAIPMTTAEIIKDNVMINVTKHTFATMGIDIAPEPIEVSETLNQFELPKDRE